MSSNLPAPATKVGGVRHGAAVYRPKHEDETATPQTNLETALGAPSNQDLGEALGLPVPNPTMSVYDAAEHPKANASTYMHDQPKHQEHDKHRSNAHGHTKVIQQCGGANACNKQ